MGNWAQIFNERRQLSPIDDLRKKYLKRLYNLTKRNIIAYYSGWLGHSNLTSQHPINDADMNAFMTVINTMDRSKGLDLILHTPGGDIAATEAIVKYLRSFFGTDIRAIIPQVAFSAGTMMACSCKEIIMGKQSNLGPIDPQFNGIPCQGVIEEFHTAIKQVSEHPEQLFAWQVVISKYHPTFLGECEKAIEWSEKMVEDWLKTGMFVEESDADRKAKVIAETLSSHSKHKSHGRHISAEECKDVGLKIRMMEDDQKLQDAILSVHHAFMVSFSEPMAPIKIVENQNGYRMLFNANN